MGWAPLDKLLNLTLGWWLRRTDEALKSKVYKAMAVIIVLALIVALVLALPAILVSIAESCIGIAVRYFTSLAATLG